MKCNLCPHQCNIDRHLTTGRCHSGAPASVSHVAVHMWEEPIISGSNGSGAIFFGGCNLACVYCQNANISHSDNGMALSSSQLADIMLALQDEGVHNINLVSPMHHVHSIVDSLQLVKHRLHIPVVYNTNSYELPSTIAMLDGLVDIYLPDLKYCSSALSAQLSGVVDYYQVATRAIECMRAQQPTDEIIDGIMHKGVIVRHMTLPAHRRDSTDVLEYIAQLDRHMYVSIMSQYTPTKHHSMYTYLNNRVTATQYDNILQYADALHLHNVFSQQLDSADSTYTPQWDMASVVRYLGDNR